MKKTILAVMLLSTTLFANECTYQKKDLQLTWTAYKTAAKIGVKGSFDSISLNSLHRETQKSFLETTTITIKTASINSKNSARDAKLVKFFFDIQNVKTITAQVVALNNNIASVKISMNGISKTVPMKLSIKDDVVIDAKGYIDLADFNMLPSLSSINKACFDLHKGKTWQDITLNLHLTLQKVCK